MVWASVVGNHEHDQGLQVRKVHGWTAGVHSSDRSSCCRDPDLVDEGHRTCLAGHMAGLGNHKAWPGGWHTAPVDALWRVSWLDYDSVGMVSSVAFRPGVGKQEAFLDRHPCAGEGLIGAAEENGCSCWDCSTEAGTHGRGHPVEDSHGS